MVKLVLETIDKISIYKSGRDFATIAGEDAGQSWEDILTYLYQLLGETHGLVWPSACLSVGQLVSRLVNSACRLVQLSVSR